MIQLKHLRTAIQHAALAGGMLVVGGYGAQAQTLTVAGTPSPLTISTASAPGQPPTSVTSSITTYTAQAKNKNQPRKITAQLNAAMPAGVTLTLTADPTTGGTTAGAVTLDVTAREIVGNITNGSNETHNMVYQLSATALAGVIAQQTRTVTFTIVAWP